MYWPTWSRYEKGGSIKTILNKPEVVKRLASESESNSYHIADVRAFDQTRGHHADVVLDLQREGVLLLVPALHVIEEIKVHGHVS